MFLTLPPDPRLAPLVHSYWIVEDIPGKHANSPIHTSPAPVAVLSVNLGRPNAEEDGTLLPDTSLLGLQSRTRSWRSFSDTYFVMAMLTLPGLVRLFPHSGSGCFNRILDLGAMAGDTEAGKLRKAIDASMESERIVRQIDWWLLHRLETSSPVAENHRLAAAHKILRSGGSVAEAAAAADVNRRQLLRWFNRHFGTGPKQLANLERLQGSLKSVQSGHSDPLAGFSDQAHQIRNWKQKLGITPAAYRKDAGSPMAAYFSANTTNAEPAFYL